MPYDLLAIPAKTFPPSEKLSFEPAFVWFMNYTEFKNGSSPFRLCLTFVFKLTFSLN